MTGRLRPVDGPDAADTADPIGLMPERWALRVAT
jgi:hypothetical protein